jgi:hypothetical protein
MKHALLATLALLTIVDVACTPQAEEARSNSPVTLSNADSSAHRPDAPERDSSADATTHADVSDTSGGPELMQTVREATMQRQGEWYRVVIPYTYTNRTGDTVYLTNCNGDVSPSLQRRVGGAWEGWWYPVMNECLSPPVVIAPGAVYRDSLDVMIGEQDREVYDVLVESRALDVRLDWQQALTSFSARKYPFGPQLPIEQRVSNAFTLRLP